MEAVTRRKTKDEEPGSYRGWAIGGGVVIAVLLAGLALWFRYHGL